MASSKKFSILIFNEHFLSSLDENLISLHLLFFRYKLQWELLARLNGTADYHEQRAKFNY